MPTVSVLPDTVLEKVRIDVKARMGKEIVVDGIQFAKFNPNVLAFVRAGSNVIFVNEIPYYRIVNNTQYAYEYLYVILLHEYLHLLGIADEREVRRITMELVKENFSETSYAFRLSSNLAFPEDVELMKDRRFIHTYM
ncbi:MULTISPECIES: hypothetical protein [Acidianus]|uniref:Metallopeptidase n=1 Tax=Candidatus Acidianus copahuensis TaxID=1160895 RepID=A0A031LPQ3_9CREN|nr:MULTISPECIES: hypothetical protein [Acidianus]EZQ07067.1 hypothetical protein CM19_06890 [Candidatus Acidianus copahuensis]NON61132.1 hypothetical protein [Acidianus sp. RZ1]